MTKPSNQPTQNDPSNNQTGLQVRPLQQAPQVQQMLQQRHMAGPEDLQAAVSGASQPALSLVEPSTPAQQPTQSPQPAQQQPVQQQPVQPNQPAVQPVQSGEPNQPVGEPNPSQVLGDLIGQMTGMLGGQPAQPAQPAPQQGQPVQQPGSEGRSYTQAEVMQLLQQQAATQQHQFQQGAQQNNPLGMFLSEQMFPTVMSDPAQFQQLLNANNQALQQNLSETLVSQLSQQMSQLLPGMIKRYAPSIDEVAIETRLFQANNADLFQGLDETAKAQLADFYTTAVGQQRAANPKKSFRDINTDVAALIRKLRATAGVKSPTFAEGSGQQTPMQQQQQPKDDLAGVLSMGPFANLYQALQNQKQKTA